LRDHDSPFSPNFDKLNVSEVEKGKSFTQSFSSKPYLFEMDSSECESFGDIDFADITATKGRGRHPQRWVVYPDDKMRLFLDFLIAM
jgi:hypothetical protein